MKLQALVIAIAFVFSRNANAQALSPESMLQGELSAQALQLFFLVLAIGLGPALLIMVTCFPFIITVLAILRQAIGLQQSPPNMLLVSLALFLTYFVMDPIFTEAWGEGISPFLRGEAELVDAWPRSIRPFENFMASRVDMETYSQLLALRGSDQAALGAQLDLSILIPSFMLSEISTAFQVGFLIFLPFLVIDLVVAAILMSMGMMMVPPAVVSLPFKLAFFVVADGWSMVSQSLVGGYLQ